jgi:protein TonB
VPSTLPAEDFGALDFGVPGGFEGGVPGGVAGGTVDVLESREAPSDEFPDEDEPVRLDFRRAEARPIARVEPVYPGLAAKSRVEGVVILEVLVDSRGVPSKVNVLKSVPLLESAAIDAVRKWRWNAYRLSDRPVPFWVTVTVSFRLT